jgi:ATP-dependent RNA helicase RhlE
MSFNQLAIIEPILRALNSEGYSSPTLIQKQAIPELLKGKDLLGCAQKKSGAYINSYT